MGYELENKSAAKKFNYNKANWQLFSEILNSQIVNISESSPTIDQLNDKITEKNISASYKSIPYLSQKIYKTRLPPNIVNFIKERMKSKSRLDFDFMTLNFDHLWIGSIEIIILTKIYIDHKKCKNKKKSINPGSKP
ncbi:hypothetical protein BpHYR1_025517 [Brachionus plicatilis]|uniref:RNA-directed DNA polymerase from mobile element jockey-like n=1 Tax=Brachionus plicatilis TaxID=10195 RepID=A0A3M7RBZ6_BRAPC|nr:hypothetical protein BpHYR1_025517 [Brachionus plicatilis]